MGAGASTKKLKGNTPNNRVSYSQGQLISYEDMAIMPTHKRPVPSGVTNLLFSGHLDASEISSVSSIPTRFARIYRTKPSRQYSALNEYFEMMCCSDNASITSLPNPLPNPKFMSPKPVRLSHSSSLYPPSSLPTIFEDSLLPFLEEYNHLCRKIDPVEAFYFLPTKTINKATAKWSAIQSTGKYDGFCNFLGESNETPVPKCLKDRGKTGPPDMFWF